MTAAIDITGLRFFDFPIVQPMCGNNKYYRRDKEIKKLLMEELFGC